MGFVLGGAGFLLIFKIFFLEHIPPEDEVPPGVVVFVALVNGLLFAFAGYLVQNYFQKTQS